MVQKILLLSLLSLETKYINILNPAGNAYKDNQERKIQIDLLFLKTRFLETDFREFLSKKYSKPLILIKPLKIIPFLKIQVI